MNMQIEAPQGGKARDDGWTARGFIRFGLICVILLGGGFGGWAATASLKGAVIASGQLRVETNRQVVQHLDGGVVAEILFRDGDVANAGDMLIRLDDTRLSSELAALESQLYEIIARRGRLEAVQTGAETIEFDPELLEAAAANPDVSKLIKGQQALFDASLDARLKEKAVMAERKLQFAEQIRGAEAEVKSLERQSELIEEELVGQRRLLASGNIRKGQVLALEREAARLLGESGQLIGEIARLRGQISEIDVELSRMDATMLEEAISQSRELGFRELELKERRFSLKDQLSRLEIRAPVGGIILDSTVHALKSVIRPAEPIMYIVPSDSELVVDARVEPINIDQMYPGQDAVMRFSAFNTRTTPEIFGKISKTSPDVTLDEQTGLSFYKAEVKMNEGELEKLEGQELVAGMPVEVYIQTGERTPLNYLMKPITDYFQRAWTEE